MGLSHSPQIVTDGLVFYYDMGNTQKSWLGAPTTNLQLPNMASWSGDAPTSVATQISPTGLPAYNVTDNNASSYLSRGNNITVANNSAIYTISIYILKTVGGTSARLGFNSGFTGGTTVAYNQRFNSDTGVGNTGTTQDLGNWWRWQFQIVNNNTGNTTLYCNFYPATGFYNSGDNAAATGTAGVSSVQIEQQTFATPFVNGTRSNTQAILDLTNNSVVTTNDNISYLNNGTFEFAPSNNNSTLTVPLSTSLNKLTGTINAWVFPRGYSSSNGIFVNRADSAANALDWLWIGSWSSGSLFYFRLGNGANCCSQDLTVSNWSTVCPINTWSNVAVTWQSGSFSRIYVNGNLIASRTITAIPNTNPSATGRIGLGHDGGSGTGSWNGAISNFSIFNRALSENEVKQNFNAIRGRVGI